MKTKKLLIVEEIFNSITHGFGALFGLTGLAFLFLNSLNGSIVKLFGFTIFGLTIFITFLASTLYHSLTFTKAKDVFQIFDKSAIFLLIAGTYTPIVLLRIEGWIGVLILIMVWTLTVLGIVMNAVFGDKFKYIAIGLYLIMGWMGMIAAQQFLARASIQEVYLLLLGGILYTAGIVFWKLERIPFAHTLWHIFVLTASLLHFLVIINL